MSDRASLDTNVLVYLFDRDTQPKQQRAREILEAESAVHAGCRRLLTEDLQDGRLFGRLRVENPFAG